MANNFFNRNKFNNNSNKKFTRVNFQIKVPSVRVVRDGEQLGILATDAARKMAFDLGYDLVEVAPNANPPVCAILSYDKYRYEQAQKEKESKRNQKTLETKEVRFRPYTQPHDLDVKLTSIRKFIDEGNKVNLVVQYKGQRELSHREEGQKVIRYLLDKLGDFVSIESMPKFEGNRLLCRISPKRQEVEKVAR